MKNRASIKSTNIFCINSSSYTKFISLRKFWYCLFSRSNTEIIFTTLVTEPLF